MPLILTADTNPGDASWEDSATLGLGYEVIQQRIQQADLPAAASTGTTFFGAAIPAGKVVLGGLIYLNEDVDVGASGITSVAVVSGVGEGSAADSCQVTADINLVGETDTPKYLHAYNDPSEFLSGVGAVAVQSNAFYGITASGGSATLSDLVAFDITIVMVLADAIIAVP
jgi:hypothetical protein